MNFALVFLVLGSSLLFGGGTRQGFLGDAAIELLAVILLSVGIWRVFSGTQPWRGVLFAAVVLVWLAVVLVAQGAIIFPEAIALTSLGVGPLPQLALSSSGGLSVAPQATWAAALSFLAPLAIFVGVSGLPVGERLLLVRALVAFAVLSVGLGLLQVMHGEASPLRFFPETNVREAVGFFANRNHLATLICVAIVFAGVVVATASDGRSLFGLTGHERGGSGWDQMRLALIASLFVWLLAGAFFTRSRAGLVLGCLAVVFSLYLFFSYARRRPRDGSSRSGGGLALVGLGAVIVGGVAVLGIDRVAAILDRDHVGDLRFVFAWTTIETALKTLPFGTGLGSFVPVYATVERGDDVFRGFANRAHNDFAEFLLESGLAGAVLVGLFLLWFCFGAAVAFLGRRMERHDIDLLLRRSGTLVILIVLVHSFVDYPLRTAAIACVFAVACALLTPSPEAPERSSRKDSDESRIPVRTARATVPALTDAPVRPTPGRTKWVGDGNWPDSWRSDDGPSGKSER